MKRDKYQTMVLKGLVSGCLVVSVVSPLSATDNNPYATADELGLMEGFPPAPDKQVTKENALLTPPFNRWSYQHMRMIYPSAPIGSAQYPVHLDRRINGSIDAVDVKHPETGEMLSMADALEQSFTDAILVIQENKVVYERYFNGMHADQPHQMMSVTKSFGGLLGLMAVEAGKLSEDDPITEYVPELKESGAFGGATFGQVLDMTNSMDFTEDYADPQSGVRKYGATLGWTEPLPDIEYESNLYDYLVTLPIDEDHAHGEIFHYQTPKTDVVNWVTNRVNGQSFQDAMYEQLWSKLGTEGETYVLLDKNATLVAGGGLNATPNNLARFATMMINDGVFNGQQVVAKSIIEKLAAGGDIDAFANGPDVDSNHPGGEWSYRAQWWVKHTPGKEAFTAIGIHGQWIYLDVNNDIAIVKLSSQPASNGDPYDGLHLNTFYAIIAHLVE